LFRALSFSSSSSIWQKVLPNFLINSNERSGGLGFELQAKHFLLVQIDDLNLCFVLSALCSFWLHSQQ
jgi:hypothetical protein